MIAIRDLPHVLAVINAATIVVLLRAYSLIRARDREGHRRTMLVAIALGVAFLTVYFVYHAFAGLAKFGGHGRSGRSTSRFSPSTFSWRSPSRSSCP